MSDLLAETEAKQPASSRLLVQVEKKIGTITLNRPEVHNAFDDTLIAELTLAVQQLEQNRDVRLIVLAAQGKSFSAGADLNWMKRMANYSWEQNYQDSLQLAGLMQTIFNCHKPTIALVQGAAFGGGVGLIACCDIVLASDSALFCLSEVKLGLIPAVISPYVIDAIGVRSAKRFFMTAEKFDAEEARLCGLVHKIVPMTTFQQDCNAYLEAILHNGPDAVLKAKNLVHRVTARGIGEDIIRETAQRIADARASAEGREGISAFLEKRLANWDIKTVIDGF